MAGENAAELTFFKKIPNSAYAGAIASFLTQPLEVLKTNLISYPSLYFKEMHLKIIDNGYLNYMRGGSLAVLRQGYGFTVYTAVLDIINEKLENFSTINKYYRFSIAAFLSKGVAMTLQAPLTLLKTRVQYLNSQSIKSELIQLMKNPKQTMGRGLNATLIRESVYSLLHYTIYRYLKDEIFYEKYGINSSFAPAFLAGTVAISVSQPFEVIRNNVSLNYKISMLQCCTNIWKTQGWRGFFIGYLPRLLRKPINSGISWSILQGFRQ